MKLALYILSCLLFLPISNCKVFAESVTECNPGICAEFKDNYPGCPCGTNAISTGRAYAPGAVNQGGPFVGSDGNPAQKDPNADRNLPSANRVDNGTVDSKDNNAQSGKKRNDTNKSSTSPPFIPPMMPPIVPSSSNNNEEKSTISDTNSGEANRQDTPGSQHPAASNEPQTVERKSPRPDQIEAKERTPCTDPNACPSVIFFGGVHSNKSGMDRCYPNFRNFTYPCYSQIGQLASEMNQNPDKKYAIVGHSSGVACAMQLADRVKNPDRLSLVALDGEAPVAQQRKIKDTVCWYAINGSRYSKHGQSNKANCRNAKAFPVTDGCVDEWCLHMRLINLNHPAHRNNIIGGYDNCKPNTAWAPQ